MSTIEIIQIEYPDTEFKVMDGFDDCIIGVAERFGKPPCIAYDQTKVIAEAREQALDRAIEEARAMGADAIVGLRYTSTEVIGRAAEFVVYGTAVKLANAQDSP